MKRCFCLLLICLLPMVVSAQVARPEPRSGHDLVWDEELGMVLLVNGDYATGDAPGKLWGWDGETWQIVSDDAPPPETLGGVAYYTPRDILLLYGGSQSAYDYSDTTWEWNGDTWQQLGGTNPGARDHLSMVYDAAHNKIVMYGGQFFPMNHFYSDTWLWDGDGAGWRQTTARAPDMRYHYAMAYDSAREQMLIFGGTTGFADQNDLWVWDGSSWTQIDTGTGPSRRSGARMAFDEQTGMMVLFGGATIRGALNDTWLWDGDAWTAFDAANAPSPRSHHAMAYDRVRQKIVLFGGYGTENLGDTWEWDSPDGWVKVADFSGEDS